MKRGEVFRATGPAPGSIIDVKLGAHANGTLAGAVIEFWYNCGAFPGGDIGAGTSLALSHYRVADAQITGWDVLSNMPSTASYRAPGAPQTNFAVECCIDELAQHLGLDPLDMRLKNAVRPGDPGPSGVPHGSIVYIECLEAAKAHPHWTAPLGAGQGRGIAGGQWMNYGGSSTAQVSVADDGSVLVTEGNPDIGGSRAAMAMMARIVAMVPAWGYFGPFSEVASQLLLAGFVPSDWAQSERACRAAGLGLAMPRPASTWYSQAG